MDEFPRPQPPSGWSLAKIIGVLLGLIGMAGFGVCTLCGLAFGMGGGLGGLWIWVVAGGVMTFLSVWLVVTMFRKAREEREGRQSKYNSNNP